MKCSHVCVHADHIQALKGYTLAVLSDAEKESNVDNAEVEHTGALMPDGMLKISISSSELDKFHEEGAWVFQSTEETVGVKVINLLSVLNSRIGVRC